MSVNEINEHFAAIEKIISEANQKAADDTTLMNKKEQLRTIKRSIAQLERKGVPVPKEIQELQSSLFRDVEKLKSPIDGIVDVYNLALNIAIELAKLCGRNPRRDLYQKAKEKKAKSIGEDILSKSLIRVLEEMGGSSHEKEIIGHLERVLQSKFTMTDLECPLGKTPRWITKLRRVRRNLVQKDVLTQDSMRRVWTLKK